ncbi:hypothetical protein P692DRAFT_20730086 [Suillus brevipes Sb2]|nr:hypothetical protein P692DRAFT_20730086 [Suillus brevipes Sb2]
MDMEQALERHSCSFRDFTLHGICSCWYDCIRCYCHPSERGCWCLLFIWLFIVAAEGLLIIRTYAFWKQNKRLLAVLLVLAAISIACAVSITQVVNNLAAPPDPSAPPTSNCTFEAGRSSAIQYGFLVAYELLLMSLTVFKRYQDYRDSNSRLVRAIFHGGVRYMTAIIFVSIVNILIMSVVPQSYDEMMDVPQLVLHSMLASRVLFSLRESDQEMDGTTLQMSAFHPVQYNQRHSASVGHD